MRRLSTVLYPILTKPVINEVPNHRWHSPLSEPVRRIGLVAAVAAATTGLIAPVYTPVQAQATSVASTNNIVPQQRTLLYQSLFVPVPFLATGDNSVLFSSTNAIVSYRKTILYQSLADVVQTTTAETVTIDKWLAPLSEPPKRRAYPAFHQDEFFFVGSDTARDARWLTPLSEPVRRKGQPAFVQDEYSAAPFTPAETDLRWFTSLSEPVRRRGQPVFEQDELSAAPFTPAESDLRWLSDLSEPVRRKSAHALQDELFFIGSDTSRDARWFSQLSEPVRVRRAVEFPALSWSYYTPPSTEVVTVDKWFVELSGPVRFRLSLAAHQQQWLAFVKAAPFPETVSADRWQQPLSEPVRRRGYLPQHQDELFFIGSDTSRDSRWFMPLAEPTRRKPIPEFPASAWSYYTPPSTEVVTVDKYFSWFSEPVRFRRSLPAFEQPYIAFVKAAPFAETVSIDRWLLPLSEPVRRRGQPASLQDELFFIGSDVARDSRWFMPLHEPVRRKGLASALIEQSAFLDPFPRTVAAFRWQQSLSEPVRVRRPADFPSLSWTWGTFVVETVTLDKWFEPFVEWPRMRQGLGAHLQPDRQYFVSVVVTVEPIIHRRTKRAVRRVQTQDRRHGPLLSSRINISTDRRDNEND